MPSRRRDCGSGVGEARFPRAVLGTGGAPEVSGVERANGFTAQVPGTILHGVYQVQITGETLDGRQTVGTASDSITLTVQ